MDLALSVTAFVAPLEPSGSLDASLSFRLDEDKVWRTSGYSVRAATN